MKRKNTYSRHPKTVLHYLIRLFVILLITVGIITAGSYILPLAQTSFCANSISCVKDLTVHPQENAIAFFDNQKILAPNISFSGSSSNAVLGATTAPGPKHIYVDLNKQTLYAYQGSTLVMKTLISSGKWHPTPDGNFFIWVKLRATRMTGGEGADFYDLPNVPYVMFFANDVVSEAEGFSLHGAYWHDNFGHPMSHGCVNMRIADAKAIYDWASPTTTGLTTYASSTDPGTEVTIVGSAPGVSTTD